MNLGFLQDLLGSVADRGRDLVERAWRPTRTAGGDAERLATLAPQLLSNRGEASGVSIASAILSAYQGLSEAGRTQFFEVLAERFAPDPEAVRLAAASYSESPTPGHLAKLIAAVEPPRQELFRRLNLAPGGTERLVRMREDLLDRLAERPEFAAIDRDMVHLFTSWFNRGFLVLKRIDWTTSAAVLDRIIRYEAVHTIGGFEDLRRRLEPADRRLYAFFHPALVDEPLIFVEVALTRDIPGSIQEVLSDKRQPLDPAEARTAVFYSISNCQEGLRGISFGNFLIKQVVEELCKELRGLTNFVTLSPVPGFRAWLEGALAKAGPSAATDAIAAALEDTSWASDPARATELRALIEPLAAHYLVDQKTPGGRPLDPVARFHLGNGARLERVNWLGNTSPKGLAESCGVMVNYLYALRDIEANHEAFANTGAVVASTAVRKLARAAVPLRPALPAPEAGEPPPAEAGPPLAGAILSPGTA